jgi:cytochrome c-type biogenesis protein CcmH/NrfG
MVKASDAITTERELDERLLDLQQKKLASSEKVRRRQLHFDIGVLVFVLLLLISYASIPVLPEHLAEQVGRYVDGSWGFLPVIFVSLAFSRVVTYMLTRSYPHV